MTPWTFAVIVEQEPSAPRFAPDARLVCRITEPSASYCIKARCSEWMSGYKISAEVSLDGTEPPAHEFGWLADSAFLSLAGSGT